MSIAEREQVITDRFILRAREVRAAQKAYFRATRKAQNTERGAMQEQKEALDKMREAEALMHTAVAYIAQETRIEVIGTEDSNLLILVSEMLAAQTEWIRTQSAWSKEKAMRLEAAVDSWLGMDSIEDPNQLTIIF